MIVKIISKGAVYKKSVGKHSYWYCVIEYLDENGKKGKKYIRGFNAKDAREKGNQFMAEFNSVKAQYSRKTLNEIFDELIAVKQLSTPIRDSSVITLRSTYNNNIRDSIGNIPMCELTTMTIQSLLDDVCRGKTSDSIPLKVRQIIDECWNLYMDKIDCNCDIVSFAKVNKNLLVKVKAKAKYFTAEESEMIYQAAKEYAQTNDNQIGRLAYAVILLLYTGMRVGELQALSWEDVDFENRVISIHNSVTENSYDSLGNKTTSPKVQNATKTPNGKRKIYLHSRAIEALTALHSYYGYTNYVVASTKGGIIRQNQIGKSFHKILEKTAFDKAGRTNLHLLRHTFSTTIMNNGVGIENLSPSMGHASPDITMSLYVHDNENRALNDLTSNRFFN